MGLVLLLSILGLGVLQPAVVRAQDEFQIIQNPSIVLPPALSQPIQTLCQPPSTFSTNLGRCVYPQPQPEVVLCQPPATYSQRLGRCVYPEVVTCDPPATYSQRLGRCVYPEVVKCDPPATYSQRLARCVYPEVVQCQSPAKYSQQLGRCVYPQEPPPQVVSCDWPLVRSGNVCVCAKGYVSSRGRCVQPQPKEVVDVRRIQQCLTVLGYDPGPIDGASGRRTISAFVSFQGQNGLASRPNRLSDKPTQARLYELCEAPPPPPPPPVIATPVPQPTDRCLSRDLYDLMVANYGERPGVSPCPSACLPKPVFYSEARLTEVAQRDGVDWCDQCIQLGAWLPLTTILEIEQAANVTLCASPAPLCYLPGRPAIYKETEIRTIYKNLPVSVGNEGDIAVVIGNENYYGDVPPNVYGNADADAVVQLLTEQLGYREENIIVLKDATFADFERVFGTQENPQGELAQRIAELKPDDVFIYQSLHGMTSPDVGTAYLMPVDGDPERLGETAYPVQLLYANLGQAGAGTIMLMLEATFGKTITDLVNAPNLPELEVIVMPEHPVPGLAVFTASDRDQHTLEDPEYGIGLFTRYMIAGLAGEADAAPLGNADKRIDSIELFLYASDMVRTAARKSHGLEQKPILSKIDNLVVGQLAAN
jgi:peptidoglycan hydrolase-like protein with peptidoglycan-binding domain